MDSGIAGWIKQKIRSIIESRPQFITNQTQFRLIKEIKGYYGVYDGKEHSVQGYTFKAIDRNATVIHHAIAN